MSVETFEVRPGVAISRVIKGGWQLAGGHGVFDREQAIADMSTFVDAGVFTFDCADIYTGVEDMIGEFLQTLRAQKGAQAAGRVRVHTKLVPDLSSLHCLQRDDVRAIVDRSLRRLNLERLHMVQFFWWDLSLGQAVETLAVLKDLQAEGKIELLGVTNWSQTAMQGFVDQGFDIATAQVQYSLLDARPSGEFSKWCAANQVSIVCYGVLAGGFLTEHWHGQADPGFEFENRSLIKYRLIIEDFGGWVLFQSLLDVLDAIARKHRVPIAAVAASYMLAQREVAAVIIGAKTARNLNETLAIFDVVLDSDDLQRILSVLNGRRGPTGEVYALEGDRNGPHGRIMKYNLNTQ